MLLLECRGDIKRQIRGSGRALKKLVADPLQGVATEVAVANGGWLDVRISDAQGMAITEAYERAICMRDERDALQAALLYAVKAARESVQQDRVELMTRDSMKVAEAAEQGFDRGIAQGYQAAQG